MEYYIVLNGVKEGPFALEELKAKGVTESTLVWKNGLTDWVKASTLPEVMQALYTAPAAPQPQAAPVPPQPILAIVSFICCGVIGAIFAILGYIAGGEVKKFWMLGQTEMAEKKAADAKKWFKIAIIVDVVLAVLIGGIYALNIALTLMNS